MNELLLPLVNGLAAGALLFMVAAGLTLLFGVMGVVNFAHGNFVMLGAYLLFALTGGPLGLLAFAGLAVVAALATGAGGALTERLVIRRIYGSGELYVVLATYAVLLLVQGLVEEIWGLRPVSVALPSVLRGGVSLGGVTVPVYALAVLVSGLLVALLLWLLLSRSELGRQIRAAAEDRTTTQALGINVPLLYTIVFTLSIFLAGLAGAMLAGNTALTPGLGVEYVIGAFAVVVVGGLGSIPGALLGALVLGVADSAIAYYVPVLTGITFYVAMALVLIIRPHGLLGTPA